MINSHVIRQASASTKSIYVQIQVHIQIQIQDHIKQIQSQLSAHIIRQAQIPYTNTRPYRNTNTRPYENTNTKTIISSHHRASSCQRQVLAREVQQLWHQLLEPIHHVRSSVILRLYSSDHHHYSIIIICSSY